MFKDFFFKISDKFSSILLNFNKFFASNVLRKKYIRVGGCKSCGRCCQRIYVRHSLNVIKDEEEFNRLKSQHFFYGYLKVIDKDEAGLVFECTKLNKETGKCTAYKHRAIICRQYPVEEVFMLGGIISEDCGYKFVPIRSFQEVFDKINNKNQK